MSYTSWMVLLGTSLLGGAAGLVGTLAVLRRRALVGDLFAHAALPGLCIAFLFIGSRHFTGMLAGALVSGLAAAILMTLIRRHTRTKEDAALGIILSSFFGFGILLSSMIQSMEGGGAKAGLETFIFGQAAGITMSDVVTISIVSAFVLIVVVLLYKELKLLGFDPEFAAAAGFPVLALDLFLTATLALITVTGLPTVGAVLMAAMLILPGAGARFWTERFGMMLILATVFGVLAATGGVAVSSGLVGRLLLAVAGSENVELWSLPTGPVIVLTGTAVFLFSVVFAPERGVLSRFVQQWRFRNRTAEENLLRTLFEMTEPSLPDRPAIPVAKVFDRRSWSRRHGQWLVGGAVGHGMVESPDADTIRLTERGLDEGRRLTETHRLWELYLMGQLHLPPDHVDRDADAIEHFVDDRMRGSLREQLAEAESSQSGRKAPLPRSPHKI